MTNRQRNWLDNASRCGGSFVKTFAMACFCADADNFQILLPALEVISAKYPVYFDARGTQDSTELSGQQVSKQKESL